MTVHWKCEVTGDMQSHNGCRFTQIDIHNQFKGIQFSQSSFCGAWKYLNHIIKSDHFRYSECSTSRIAWCILHSCMSYYQQYIFIWMFRIDVSERLFPKICHYDFIQSLDSSVVSIVVPNWVCNDVGCCTSIDFTRFSSVESIEIGDHCYAYVETFRIEGLKRLKCLKIGKYSFTQHKNESGSLPSKSFHIVNCESLKSIEIGIYSFSDFGGEFELKKLKSLQSLNIGVVNDISSNFSECSFVIRGNGVLWASHHQIFPG